MINKIKNKISEYLTFDIKKIINEDVDECYIFGGAIRDIIADMRIHDIDILCMSQSHKKLSTILEKEGYYLSESIGGLDINSMYKDIHCIFQPHNWIKIVNGEIRLVQLIRPLIKQVPCSTVFTAETGIDSLLRNVDLSCCGVFYSHNDGLKESIEFAIDDCLNKRFIVHSDHIMHQITRSIERINKLESRGWKQYHPTEEIIQKRKRIKKLKRIL